MFKRATILLYLLLFIFLGLSWQGCNVINPSEPVPTYIHIDSFQFQGSSSHEIVAIWVYYNNNPVGEFDLPATFPIVATGTGSLEISPAIKIDGQNEMLTIYPYYTIDTSTFTAQPGKIINYTPKTGYYSDAKITTISDFSYGITGFATWEGNVNMVTVTADSQIYKDTWAGGIFLSAAGDSSIDSTVKTITIPYGSTGFVELDYNTTVPFYLGLQANLSNIISSTPYFLTGIKPNGQWQKFYFNVGDFATTYQGTSYNLYIKAVLNPGQTSGRALFDNIKLVTF